VIILSFVSKSGNPADFLLLLLPDFSDFVPTKVGKLVLFSVIGGGCDISGSLNPVSSSSSTDSGAVSHIYHKVTCYPAHIYCCLCSTALCPIPVSWSLYYAALHGVCV
jgi:hypothetical protein